MQDIKKMFDNSRLYNGDNHIITQCALQMFELASKKIVEKDHQFIRLEKMINPLLDEDDKYVSLPIRYEKRILGSDLATYYRRLFKNARTFRSLSPSTPRSMLRRLFLNVFKSQYLS